MFDVVTAQVLAWLKSVAGDVEVLAAPPGAFEGTPAILCHLTDLSSREPRPGPFRRASNLGLRYLVTARAPDTTAAHALLGKVVHAALQHREFQTEFVQGNASMWLAFGAMPRPCFFLHVPLQIGAADDVMPPVTEPVEVRMSAVSSLRGRVVGRGRLGLARARVTLPELARSTRTDDNGEFSFSGLVPTTGHRRIVIEKGGLTQVADVDTAINSVLIEFAPQKV